LLLLRGLIGRGVLSHSLQKRWRVDYGQAHGRSPPTGLAVPYRAKDTPARQAEFSHPEVVIILTCLSYYYDGLSSEELAFILGRLPGSTEGKKEYESWMESAPGRTVPEKFRRLDG
ncbi:hypothetical protein B0H67DRAFT_467288, partial [Lasiosphaeris hirsuta]